jgi:hypothetical protein
MFKGLMQIKIVAAAVAAVAVAGGACAFTAANTVPASNAGAGSGTVSGFTGSNLHYGLNTTTPGNVDSPSFTVSPTIPSTGSGKVTVQAALATGGPSAYQCTTKAACDTVTCPTTGPQLTADRLSSVTVVAAP